VVDGERVADIMRTANQYIGEAPVFISRSARAIFQLSAHSARMSSPPSRRAPASPLLSKLEGLRAQRNLLRQEVEALSNRDRELAKLQGTQPVPHEPGHGALEAGVRVSEHVRTPMAERLETGLQAMAEPSPSPLAATKCHLHHSLTRGSPAQLWSAWSIHRMPEPSASPVMQRHLSIEELKAIVSNSMSQINSRPPTTPSTPANRTLCESMASRGDLVSRALPPMASHQHHRSSPPRPKSLGENWHRELHVKVPHSLPLDREANRVPVLPPDTAWTPPELPSAQNRMSPPKQGPKSASECGLQSEDVTTTTELQASSRRLAAQEQELKASKEQLRRQGQGLRESQVWTARALNSRQRPSFCCQVTIICARTAWSALNGSLHNRKSIWLCERTSWKVRDTPISLSAAHYTLCLRVPKPAHSE
jgi:hypothetical protein